MRQSRHLGLFNNKEYIIDRLVTYAANLSNYTDSLTIIVNDKQKEYNFSNADWKNLDQEAAQSIINYSLSSSDIKNFFDKIKHIKPDKSIIQYCINHNFYTRTDCSNYCNLVWSLVLGQWIDFPYASRVYDGNIYLLNNKISYFKEGQVNPNAYILFTTEGTGSKAGDVRFVYFNGATNIGQASSTNLNQHFYTLIGDQNESNTLIKIPTSEYAGAPSIKDRSTAPGTVYISWHYTLNIENKNYIKNTGNSSQLDDNDYTPTINDLDNFLNNIKNTYTENSIFIATNSQTEDLANSILIYLNLNTVTKEQMINIITASDKWEQLYNIISEINDNNSNESEIKNQLIQKIQDLNS